MVTITDQNIRIGGLRVRNSPHETIGDCRCYDCVELLAEVYRAHNIPIRTALRCARCNIILSHPQWLDKENTHYHIELRRAYHKAKSDKVPLANVCCNCLQNIQSLYDNGPPQPSYHIRSGILGAEARRARQEMISLQHCMICNCIGANLICRNCED